LRFKASNLMLPKKHRLSKKKDFERVLKQGRGLKKDFLSLKTIENDLGFHRFGFIVGKRVSNKANKRNKIKRRLREIVRLKLKENALISQGKDSVFIVLKDMKDMSFIETVKIVGDLLKEAGIE